MLTLLRNDLSGNIERLKRDDSDALIGFLVSARVSPARYGEFARRLGALAAEFDTTKDESGTPYALNLALYPQRLDYGPIGHYALRRSRPSRKTKPYP